MEATWLEPEASSTRADARVKIERENHKLEKRLCRQVGQAIVDYNMIEEGDKVMVCVSGGKDSYAMLDILLKLQARAPVHFELIAVNLDQKQPGFPEHVLPQYLEQLGVPFHIENQDTYSIVKRLIPEGKTLCSLCSRLRRGILYRVADELGATKIALGHHRDDILQTFFLNMFFGGKLKGMPPKLVSDDGRHIVIRPMAQVAEKDLVRWAAHRQFPIIPCTLCGSQANLQRKQVARMLQDWEKQHPGPHREHVHRVTKCRAFAPDGRNAARLQGSEGDRRGQRRRRQGLRHRRIRGARGPAGAAGRTLRRLTRTARRWCGVHRPAAPARHIDQGDPTMKARLYCLLLLVLALSGCSGMRIVDSDVRAYTTGPGASPCRPPTASNGCRRSRPCRSSAPRSRTWCRPNWTRSACAATTPRRNTACSFDLRMHRDPRSPWDDPRIRRGFLPGLPGRDAPRRGLPLPARRSSRMDMPWYRREVSLLMRRLSDGVLVFETRASSDGYWSDDEAVVPAMFEAALRDFPNPPPGPRRVKIEIPR